MGMRSLFKAWSPTTSILERPDSVKNNGVRAKPDIRRTADEKKCSRRDSCIMFC